MFTLKFKTDNEAFHDNKNVEVARILRAAAHAVEIGSDAITLAIFDSNGNTIGRFTLDNQA